MRAWVIEEHGGPEVFKQIELPRPEPGPGQVRIRVAATSVNPVDCKIRSGAAEALCPPKVAILHGDVSGVIDAVGEEVERYKIGDKVYGCVGGYGPTQGVLADFTIADQYRIWHAPQTIAIEDAAALPLASITAFEGIKKTGISESMRAVSEAGIDKPMQVLVHAGTGGVGHIAVQAIKGLGAYVATTVSTKDKAEIAARLGADDVINYHEEDIDHYVARITKSRGFDLVFDTVGGPNLAASIQSVKHNGQVVCIQGRTEIDGGALHAKGVSLHLVFMLIPYLQGIPDIRHTGILKHVAKLVDEHKLRPLIDALRFSFDSVADAHAYAESGKQIGKVLVVHPDHA
ncbi:MAG: zinc-binding dehydrogenase [Phycisphaeraceae bacterium]